MTEECSGTPSDSIDFGWVDQTLIEREITNNISYKSLIIRIVHLQDAW